ncbi:armadillo-type protein [Fomitopsis serialis]|uniref:armadillo-type protein n=1 Tax=Fomitopsis serialis TaxID=139415 RepID=UPI0020086317|nr:armadillo-type protein [Neoantrodia serialis]KAH9925284.1 armadillo-type protein [Neoantrodia serialis]
MPRENRKRGKKHRKPKEDDYHVRHERQESKAEVDPEEQQAGPSWIVHRQAEESDKEAPFGYVDAEVKAYFRTVDLQIREWQEQGRPDVGGDEDTDPNEDRRLFFVAALTEMEGKEKQLATDKDCSIILERMIHSMDDFVRRVYMDRLDGSFEQLVTHRFASHVCQTMFTVAADTISRETRGILPTRPEDATERGELRSLTQLVLDACDELLPRLSSLVLDPFASHVISALLLLLAPDCFPLETREHAVRSKKSTAWKARQGSMKSVFKEKKEGVGADLKGKSRVPGECRKVAEQFVRALREQLGENEVRALAADKVASPVLQMLLEIEAEYGMAEEASSLMDRALVGMISSMEQNPNTEHEPSDYLNTLLRDPTASHLLETLVKRAPARVFTDLWATYFADKLARLAVHPIANFVLQKALVRVATNSLGQACAELNGEVAGKIVKTGRVEVLQALVDRAAELRAHEEDVVQVVRTAFVLQDADESSLVVPCILRAINVEDYKAALLARAEKETRYKEKYGELAVNLVRQEMEKEPGIVEPKVQGALLLQSLLRLSSPHNELVLNSLQSLTIDELIVLAHHPMSSRVLDVLLSSPTVPMKLKRKFILGFMGRFHELVDDRIGSRVGERCWAVADGYMKEKIARSVMPHEHFLTGSMYGKYFARALSLQLLKRDPDRWHHHQSGASTSTSAPTASQRQKHAPVQTLAQTESSRKEQPEAETIGTDGVSKKRKRKAQPENEIDALFEAKLGKRVKKGELKPVERGDADEKDEQTNNGKVETRMQAERKAKKGKGEAKEDKDLRDVLGRSCPRQRMPARRGRRGREKADRLSNREFVRTSISMGVLIWSPYVIWYVHLWAAFTHRTRVSVLSMRH